MLVSRCANIDQLLTFFVNDHNHRANCAASLKPCVAIIYLHLMLIQITPTRLVQEIQQEFSRMFPFLKLEFFVDRHSKAYLSAEDIAPGTKRIGDIQRSVTDGPLDVNASMKVNDLEETLFKQFNLAAQVFRKSGKIWLETTMTDNWTLQQQNNHGQEISTEKKPVDKEDYDLNRNE